MTKTERVITAARHLVEANLAFRAVVVGRAAGNMALVREQIERAEEELEAAVHDLDNAPAPTGTVSPFQDPRAAFKQFCARGLPPTFIDAEAERRRRHQKRSRTLEVTGAVFWRPVE